MTIIIDGQQLAQTKEKQLAQKVAVFKDKTGISPKLVCFLVGDDPASKIYLRLKQRVAKRVGIGLEIIEETELIKLTELIKEKNQDNRIHGIMVQLPLPKSLEITRLPAGQGNSDLEIIGAIAPSKDVDGLTGRSKLLPAVVKAILEIIKFADYSLANTKIVIVGQGKLVGQPLAAYLKNLGAKVLVADINTPDLASITKQAEILVVATGQPGLIKKNMVKPGALVIDAGSPKPEVDPSAALKAGFYTPVPGGVGPLTVVSLLENVLLSADYAIIRP